MLFVKGNRWFNAKKNKVHLGVTKTFGQHCIDNLFFFIKKKKNGLAAWGPALDSGRSLCPDSNLQKIFRAHIGNYTSYFSALRGKSNDPGPKQQ